MSKTKTEYEKFKVEIVNQMICGTSKTGHTYGLIQVVIYKELPNLISYLVYKCQNCKLKMTRQNIDLSPKEVKALKLFGYKF